MSFAAIQQLQAEQDHAPVQDKRSLREIQQEERERQVEADFLKWWAAEEERLEAEAQAVRVQQGPKRLPKPKKTKTQKAKPAAVDSQQQRGESDTRAGAGRKGDR